MHSIKKQLSIILVFATVLFASHAQAGEIWDMPMAYNDANYHTVNGKLFSKAVNICTGGELVINVHGGGSLFKGNEIKRAVQTGQAQIGERLLSAHANENAVFGFDSIPFLATSFADSETLKKAAASVFERVLDKQNLVMLYSVPWPSQGLYFNQEVNTISDMKGIKFRSYNASTARLAELSGMVPVQIEAAELVQALATGVAGAFVSSGSTGYDKKVWEHLSHFYDVQGWLPRNTVFVNKKIFNALPKQSQNCLKSSAMLASAAGTARAEQLADWYVAQLAANGMKTVLPSDQLKADLVAIGKTLSAEWSAAAGADGKAIIDAYNRAK